jgi:hypothetical protein
MVGKVDGYDLWNELHPKAEELGMITFLSYHILSYPILSYPILSYPILSNI